MPQKYQIPLCAIISWLAAILFSCTAVANDGKKPPKEPPCEDLRLINLASENWCRANGWERDPKSSSWWVQKKKGKKELKAPDTVAYENDESERTLGVDKNIPPQSAVSATPKKELNRLPSVNRVEKTSDEQQIYWTEGKRIHTDHISQAPKGGWR